MDATALQSVGRWLAIASIGGGLACSEPLTVHRVSESELLASLTPEAASALDGDGKFILPTGGGAGSGEISAERAKELALAIWQSHSAFLLSYAEADRGAPIASADLVPCPRAYYAESAHEPLGETYPSSLRRHFGAQWLVGLCHGSEQQVAVAIAATATNLNYERLGGRIRFQGARSGDFMFIGVKPGASIPIAPEVAVVLAASATERRAASVPVLRRRAAPHSALNSTWSVELEQPIDVRGKASDVHRSVREIAVGHFEGWMTPKLAVEHPGGASSSISESVTIRDRTTGSERQFQLRRRSAVPKRLEPFSVGGQ